MPEEVEVIRSNLGTPRSPVSISTDSSRRGSLRPAQSGKNSEPPPPSSPRARMTRKRAASLDLDSANHPRIEDLALSSASTSIPSTADATREQVCLCQPDPKIPRPRNAFILYRQHYQAQVVAQHPGLANPEISKIIGEQWREQAPEVKSEWKRLAEVWKNQTFRQPSLTIYAEQEEKQRHQRQYPGYRYQPRRSGKGSGIRPLSPSTPGEDPIRCPKCNGRYISTPSTPLTPFTPALSDRVGLRNDRLPPPFTPGRADESDRSRYHPHMQHARMDTPRMEPPPLQQVVHRRAPYPHPQTLQTHHEMDEEMDLLSPSPDLKRRRFNSDVQRYNSDPRGYPQQAFSRSAPLPISAGPYRQQNLPGLGMLARLGGMGPPPSHSPVNPQLHHHYPPRASAYDESLRLSPLQIQLPNQPSALSARLDRRSESRETQAKSVEAMIMTIPYINKIKVLTKISPPLVAPGPTSPAQETRGVVIVIEGAHKTLRDKIGAFINDHLSNDSSCAVRTWGNSNSRSKEGTETSADTHMADEAVSPRTNPPPAPAPDTPEEKDPFVDYFTTISEWHKNSQEMIKHITTTPHPPAPPSHPTTRSTSSEVRSQKAKIIPIALIPHGFSITISDTFARRIPINDSYAPVDHWQWMATLWRGIVGPDLTIYVDRVGREEMAKFGGVEVRRDCSAIVVRVLEGESTNEKTARRLGFEVLEFVKGMEGVFWRT
ncbi:hypothetical protein G7Y89_g1349 [Cudoniella acicularis]|uniref:HMG box domain-containing protein n=1 Tax=Cudoniella acicularis TaxID=354080 RepID=A0A8H4RVF4_9HELO|nr:hypothetical protein G7Y89_g1349 [Cudoniella acicularis]